MLKNEKIFFTNLVQSSDLIVDELAIGRKNDMVTDIIETSKNELLFYYDVHKGDEVIFSNTPQNLKELSIETKEKIDLIKTKQHQVLIINKSMETKNGVMDVTFRKNISKSYSAFWQKVFVTYLIGIAISSLLSYFLYYQMKKIYRPIQNLSHELRTPLTLIKGYSDMMLRMKTSEEQKISMSSEIYEASNSLQEVIEQLLLMGDLREGDILKESLYLSSIFEEFKEKYDLLNVVVKHETDVQVNRILILRLIDNLLANAYRVSQSATVEISESSVLIVNEGATIPSKTLRKMNRGKPLQPHEYSGTGQGFIICFEIMQLHNGKIHIESAHNQTKVTLVF